uniref:Uncharacterized protein n=1 Tax=Strombidium rassoulzadegani TaxID=1082188 RepID=A0A7S3CRA5_9SPIT|mmetsp:Transcript_5019/g.8554  ORF Transcript_5019/g.8554 Transcript_5019/m.8554 type:complete len:257 (+) Transcript_5019:282-1052(+)
MNIQRSAKSMLIPWQNEFVQIWLNIAFAVYFWVQLILVGVRSKEYQFNTDFNYWLMFVATVSIAIFLTVSALYFTFYSMSPGVNAILSRFYYMAALTLAFGLAFVYFASEFQNTKSYFTVVFLTLLVFTLNLVLIQYDQCRLPALWISLSFIGLILFIDMVAVATSKTWKVFYLPLLLESVLLSVSVALLFFRVPERWCKKSRPVQLYLTSSLIFTLLLINFLVEFHNVLYYTLKANSSDLDNEESWWEVKNIYNE